MQDIESICDWAKCVEKRWKRWMPVGERAPREERQEQPDSAFPSAPVTQERKNRRMREAQCCGGFGQERLITVRIPTQFERCGASL